MSERSVSTLNAKRKCALSNVLLNRENYRISVYIPIPLKHRRQPYFAQTYLMKAENVLLDLHPDFNCERI